MRKNSLMRTPMRICMCICIGIAAVVVLIILATKIHQVTGQQQRSELVKRVEEAAQTLNCDGE